MRSWSIRSTASPVVASKNSARAGKSRVFRSAAVERPVVRKIISLWLETRIVLREFTETSVDERGPVAWWAQGWVG
jgi:hypothetical protein